jgi:hypothetical protein
MGLQTNIVLASSNWDAISDSACLVRHNVYRHSTSGYLSLWLIDYIGLSRERVLSWLLHCADTPHMTKWGELAG